MLSHEGTPFALTLERPWINNIPNESCIPIGLYDCKKYHSPRHGNTYEILNVLNRGNGEAIIFHKGNTDTDSKGCILIGEQFELINGKPGILRSGDGFNEFITKLNGINWFKLLIVNT